MTTQDKLAAATIAKIFGSEMLYVQQNAKTDGGATPNIGIVHPRDILQSNTSRNSQYSSQRERQMLEMLQREAESSCPLPQESIPHPSPNISSAPVLEQTTQTAQTSSPIANTTLSHVDATTEKNVWERIATSLEQIAFRLNTIEFTAKKVKRNRKKILQ
jgi:hypothetical protein